MGRARFTFTSMQPMTPDTLERSVWPVTLDAIAAARDRIRPFIPVSPLRAYPVLDAEVGHDITVAVKHENFNPTNSFKVRNAFSLLTALTVDERRRGIVAATRGNHGLGLAYAGKAFGIPVTICVPLGNNPEKNAAMRALGARLIEEGRDYDESVLVADRIVRDEGARLAHSTNNPHIIAGAGTMSLEIAEQEPALDALVLAVGGGSQAVGAMTVMRALKPHVRVYAVQAAGASAAHESWHAGEPRVTASADTFADGLATRSTYELTFPALREGLTDFVTVTDAEIARALRLLLQTTHSLVEGAGATGFAGLLALRDRLAGQRVGIVLSGGNIDERTLRRVVNQEI
jgi:threonine dehydratase